MVLYQVLPEAVHQEVTFYDFLAHIEQAQISMPTMPLGKLNHDYRTVRDIGGDWRHSLATFPPAEVRYSLTLPQRPVLRFAIGRMYPPCNSTGSFQIWIETVGGERIEVYRRDLRAGNTTQSIGWYEEEIDLARFANEAVYVVFKSEYAGPRDCDWFVWADPILAIAPESSKIEP